MTGPVLRVAVSIIASMSEAQRRALAALVATACRGDFWPRAVVTIGGTDLADALRPGRVSALWLIEPNGAAEFLAAPALKAYLASGVPVVCLARNVSDAQTIRTALGRDGTA